MCGSSPPNYLCRLGGYVRPEGAAGLNVVKAPGMVCRLVRTYHPGGVRAPRGGCHAREPARRSPAIDGTGGAVCFHPQESHSVSFESYGERLQEMLGPHPPRTGGRFPHRSLRRAEHLRPSLPYHSESYLDRSTKMMVDDQQAVIFFAESRRSPVSEPIKSHVCI